MQIERDVHTAQAQLTRASRSTPYTRARSTLTLASRPRDTASSPVTVIGDGLMEQSQSEREREKGVPLHVLHIQ